MIPVTMVDATGVQTGGEVLKLLRERGVLLATAGRQGEWERWAAKRHIELDNDGRRAFPSLHTAVDEYVAATATAEHETAEVA